MDLINVVFPRMAGLRIMKVLAKGASVRVYAQTSSVTAACPQCATPSRRVHSRYERRLLDTAIAGQETVLHLRVRRFFCTAGDCVRKIFVEQVDGLTVRWARISVVARTLLEAVALALGGRAGARLARRLGLGVGRMTLIRAIRALPLPVVSVVSVLGVDDFALRRGHRYGTVLVDMATHQVIDVLDDRSADSLAAWLREHPGVEIVCRDRAGCYADGAAAGAPAAVQVADRWHLLKNLSDAVYKAVAGHRRCLQPLPPAPAVAPGPTPQVEPPTVGTPLARRTRIRHAEVHALWEQGLGIYSIASRLGLDPRRCAATPMPPTPNS
ncbi:ISL3 family transposase [Micromonospora sp. NPDC006431]|uniref:ISL3 family transposase n=1 Tax=Micromonospora sp. NPDC006431 TaxID=3364235 RepID=UPI0036B8DFA5